MSETQTSNNWRGNETFSKPRPFRDEVIDDWEELCYQFFEGVRTAMLA